MEEIILFVGEHIVDLFLGIGVVITTIVNKPKTAEQLKKLKARKLFKTKKTREKLIEKLKEVAKLEEELEKE